MMGALLAGMAGGYVNGLQRNEDRERQAKIDAREEARFAREKKNWDDADRLQSDLKDAAAPVTLEQGAGGMVKPNYMDNRDVVLPENAALPNGGLMQGAYKVGGRSFADQAQADKEMAAQNNPDAVNQRTVDAYRKNGLVKDAMTMQNAAVDTKLKALGLTKAEAEHADETFDRKLKEKVPMGKGFGPYLAQVLSDTKVAGLEGEKFEAVSNPDGKSFEMVGTRPNGEKFTRGTFTDDNAGWAEAMRQANSAKLETKIGYVVETAKTERANKELELKERKVASDEKKSDAMAFKLMQGGGSNGSVPNGKVNMDAIDKALAPLFTKEDATSGAKVLDTNALMTVRALATRMPAAATGDAMGAALQAHTIYASALKNAGGDHTKAVQIIQQATNPQAAQPAPAGNQAVEESKFVPKPKVSMVDQAYENSLKQLKSNAGAYGQFFMGPNDFKKIATDEKAPKWQRETAKRYLSELDMRTQTGNTIGN